LGRAPSEKNIARFLSPLSKKRLAACSLIVLPICVACLRRFAGFGFSTLTLHFEKIRVESKLSFDSAFDSLFYMFEANLRNTVDATIAL